MAAETHYSANTGLVKISTANSNLDGTGTLGNVITGGDNGTLIKRVIIKATDTGSTSTTEGMVRLFVYDGSNTRLLTEVEIPAMGQSATNPTFRKTILLDFKLEANFILKASTENAETFVVIAEGLDFSYYTSSVRPESTNYTANTGVQGITSQNSNLDGSGTVATLVTATSSGFDGLAISSITLKAYTAVTRGMVRLFVQNTSTGAANTFLFKEIPIVPVDPTGTFESFEMKIEFPDTFQIQSGYKIVASIETAADQFINGIVDAMDWKYPA